MTASGYHGNPCVCLGAVEFNIAATVCCPWWSIFMTGRVSYRCLSEHAECNNSDPWEAGSGCVRFQWGSSLGHERLHIVATFSDLCHSFSCLQYILLTTRAISGGLGTRLRTLMVLACAYNYQFSVIFATSGESEYQLVVSDDFVLWASVTYM